MQEIRCAKCGCALERAGEEYVCLGCGAHYERESAQSAAEALAAVLDEQKQEAVANQRQLLWKELHEEYIDADGVARLAREIKKYLPKDYLANFCEVACGAGGKKLNKFLRKTDVKKQSMYVWDVLDLMFHILREENLIAVNDFLSRMLEAGADAQKYARYNARLIEESKKINAGVYDAALPRDAFIAYNSEDMEQVSELVEELEGQKISCFVAARNLQHGKVGDYEEKLEEAMKRCKVFVFVSGSHSRSRTCDALCVEMAYIRKRDLAGAPAQYRDYYEKMPEEYKKPRVEYVIEGYSGESAAEQVSEEFFAGYERCYSVKEVARRILEYISKSPAPQVKYCLACGAENASKAKFCSECGGRTFAATREQVEEEKSERESLAQEKQRAEEEKRKAEEEAATLKAELDRLQKEMERRSTEQAEEKQRAEEEEKEVPSSQGREQGENTFEKYKKAAEQGDADAQCNLGFCYAKGNGVEQNYAQAVKWYKKAAEQGNAKAQYNLGDCYYNGNGVEQDYAEAVKWLKKASEQGDADAQYNLGECYYYGNGVAQDYAEAVKWLKKASEQGHAAAQNNLGLCYFYGNGVEQSYTEAAKWFQKAAEQGDADAQYNLGECYYYGNGVVQNYAEAAKWFLKAAEQGDADAQWRLGEFYYDGHGVKQSYADAVKWYKKAAEQGLAEAQYSLGLCYYYGNGVEQSYAEAAKWFQKAAEQDDEDEQEEDC